MKGEYGVGSWKAIRKWWDLINSKVSFEVRDRRKVRLWVERWCEEESLQISFPTLYALAMNKEAWVADI